MTGMSTPSSVPPRALFAGLIDDAAVFPPGNFPLDEAISRRVERRGSSVNDLVGPLLLPPTLVSEAIAGPTPVSVSVVGRSDVTLDQLLTAAQLLVDADGHSLAGLELTYSPDWRAALELGVPVAVEVTPEQAVDEPMADLAAEGSEQVRAKLRTGSSPTSAVPSASALGGFIASATGQGLSFKLTGGMHRAVSHRTSTPDGGEDQFGFLNVLLATDQILRGSSTAQAVTVLEQRDSEVIADLVRELDDTRIANVRNAFHSYGCCDVMDPIHDLSDLGLIEETL